MANRDEIKRKKKKQKRRDFTPFIIIGVVVLLVTAVIILTSFKPVGNINDPAFHKAAITSGLTMGDPKAPVKVVEFADFQCPGCGSYWSTMEPSVIKTYVDTGKVFFTYSPFSFLGQRGSDPNWDESKKAAEAAYCANDQNNFWEYHDYLFGNQNSENQGDFSRTRLLAFAKKLSIDQAVFTKCLDSGKYKQKVEDDNTFAQNSGATFTPSFLINGQVVDNSKLIETLDAALK
jgi:protein-disulfide isomerase